MHEATVELRMQCLQFATHAASTPEQIPDLAARFLAFALHAHPEPAEYQHKLDVLARAIHDLASVVRHQGEETRKEIIAMTVATEANTAAQARLATAVDAALVVIANGGGTATADQIADAAALPASTEALNTQASRLEAVLPPPAQPAQ